MLSVILALTGFLKIQFLTKPRIQSFAGMTYSFKVPHANLCKETGMGKSPMQ